MKNRFPDRNAFFDRARGWRRLLPVSGLLAVWVLGGCSNDVVPVGSTLTLSPETHSTTIREWQTERGGCLFNPDNHVDIPVIMQLLGPGGSPIGDTTLDVYLDFTANTYPGPSVINLYDDLNGNGVVDAESELISGADDDIARVKTDQWTGSRMLLLRINLSCSFKGEMVAFTGGATARAGIEVVAGEIIPWQTPVVEETS